MFIRLWIPPQVCMQITLEFLKGFNLIWFECGWAAAGPGGRSSRVVLGAAIERENKQKPKEGGMFNNRIEDWHETDGSWFCPRKNEFPSGPKKSGCAVAETITRHKIWFVQFRNSSKLKNYFSLRLTGVVKRDTCIKVHVRKWESEKEREGRSECD